MERALVSVLTPCFNTGGYIHRLLDSVLEQTYPNIEMIVIDDGSTDNSVNVVNSYVRKFEERGYMLTLVTQKNSGQSVAIREGMKLIKGRYFVWPDSDDYYASPNAIECMVDTLEKCGDDYGLVRTQENLLEDGTFKIIGCKGEKAEQNCDRTQLFEDCLYCQNDFFYCSGAYMADFQKLKRSTTLEIYTDKDAGQNWQLLLPLLYNYNCYTIKSPLYNVVVRLASHSRGQYKKYEKNLIKIASYEQTILGTLAQINGLSEEECSKYSLEIKRKYCKERILLSFLRHKRQDFLKFYSDALHLKCIGNKERILKTFFYFPIIARMILYVQRHIVK